jgi:hypothetical protein
MKQQAQRAGADFDERAAIAEFDGGRPRPIAESFIVFRGMKRLNPRHSNGFRPVFHCFSPRK